MNDNEIRTTVLSDWQPETDVKLQRAFGKFVEEVGELFVAFESFDRYLTPTHHAVEDELADCIAVMTMIHIASDDLFLKYEPLIPDLARLSRLTESLKTEDGVNTLMYEAGKVLTIIGRCQIQGLSKSDPNHRTPNAQTLLEAFYYFQHAVILFSQALYLDEERMKNRRDAKLETKLPWIMGTATDLQPDV